MIPLFIIFLATFFVLFCFFIYILICGNNNFHRNGFIGKLYNDIMIRFPNYCNNLANKLFPKQKKDKKKRESECIGKGGPCYYFIFIFYITIYAGFVFAYVRFVHPQLQNVYKSHLEVHRVLTFLVLPWPWVLFVAFQFMDPGEITPKNVFSYIKKYPYDNVLYVEGKVCPTLHVPVVARSRYCRYTKKRIAYVFLFSYQILKKVTASKNCITSKKKKKKKCDNIKKLYNIKKM